MKMEIESLFRLSQENLEWFKENYEDLRKKYDSKWIIIQNKQVVGSGSTFSDIINAVKKYDPNSVIVEYIQSEQIAMFF